MRVFNYYEAKQKRDKHLDRCDIKIDLWDTYDSKDVADIGIEVCEHKMIKWLNKNTTGKIFCDGDLVFYFELEDDASLFKLRWG